MNDHIDIEIENFQYILARVIQGDCVVERVTVSSDLDKYKCLLIHSPDGSFIFGKRDLGSAYELDK